MNAYYHIVQFLHGVVVVDPQMVVISYHRNPVLSWDESGTSQQDLLVGRHLESF